MSTPAAGEKKAASNIEVGQAEFVSLVKDGADQEAVHAHTGALAAAGHGHGHTDFEWPPDAHFGTASLGKIGMWFFLCSDALSFGGLLLAYGILRGSSSVWHHPGEPELGINFTA